MILSIQEVGKSVPAAPKIQSQSKESEGAGAQTNWGGKHDAESKDNKSDYLIDLKRRP